MRLFHGVVKRYSSRMGYGFIAPENGGEDVFVLSPDVADAGGGKHLEGGQRVTFQVDHTPRGPVAREVRVLPSTPRSR